MPTRSYPGTKNPINIANVFDTQTGIHSVHVRFCTTDHWDEPSIHFANSDGLHQFIGDLIVARDAMNQKKAEEGKIFNAAVAKLDRIRKILND